MKVRDVSMLFSSVVRHPDSTGRAPAVKLIMAGTFRALCRARKPTSPARELGIMKPTRCSLWNSRARDIPRALARVSIAP